jgi:hypothetical protein
MAARSRTTFQKRQKELARQEKARDKAARRVQRKLEKAANPSVGGPPIEELDPLDAPPPLEPPDSAVPNRDH